MRVAALDLGSNTTLMLIADVKGGRIERVIADETTVTKLGQGVHHNKRFHPDALERVREAMSRYRQTIDASKVDTIKAVATSAARDVANGDELLQIGRDLNIPIEIISGDREANMTFLGAVSDEADRDGVAVIDVGGGSTEMIVQQGKMISGVSVNVGSVRLTDLFITHHPIPAAELQRATTYALEKFNEGKKQLNNFTPKKVIGVAGTPTTLAALEWNEPFSESKVHGFKLKLATVDAWIAKLAPLTIAEREKFRGMQPKRADVIVMGSLALRLAMQTLGCIELTVSVRGLRYGLAMEMAHV